MQAILLAAGMGKRLRYETRDKPKCLLVVNGETILERCLGMLSRRRFSRVVLVVGHRGEQIRKLLGDNYRGMPVEYVENPDYKNTNNIYSLYLARHKFAEDDSMLLESDLIFDETILERALSDPRENVAVVDKYDSRMDGTVVKLSASGNVTSIVPKAHFDYGEIGNYYKTVNIYKFSRDFLVKTYIPFLEAYCSALGNNSFYEQVLRVILTLEQNNLQALVLRGEKWFEIDTIADLHQARLLFTEDRGEKLALFAGRYGGYYDFQGLKDFCYLVNPFFSPKRMFEEFKLNLETRLSSYPAGQTVQARYAGDLLNCHEKYLVVGNGAAEIIASLMRLLPGKIGVVYPTFMEYPARIRPESLVKLHADADLRYGARTLRSAVDRVDVLVAVNPDNPTGNFIPVGDLLEAAACFAKAGKKMIVDESFVDFAGAGPSGSLIREEILVDNPNLIVIRSISKTFNVAGLRLGILACADLDLLAALRRDMPIWNVNAFGELFLQQASKYMDVYTAACEMLAAERTRLHDLLVESPLLAPLPSQANFILCRMRAGGSAEDLAAGLLFEHNILIKSLSGREGLEDGEYVRIAVRTAPENDFLIECLRKFAGDNPRPS